MPFDSEQALRPLLMFSDPGERFHWIFLVGAACLAARFYAQSLRSRSRSRPRSARHVLAFLVPVRLWKHPSSLLDLKLVLAMALFRALLAFPWGLSAYSVALWEVAVLDRVVGIPAQSTWPPPLITAVYTLTLFLVWDLSRFVLHWLMHAVPLLWEFHKVHHSAQVMTPLTLLRSHPIESLLGALRGIVVTGGIAGLFFHRVRGRADQAERLGVNVLGGLFNLLGANLRHSHVTLRWPPAVEAWVISPAQHQVHHGTRPEHHHRNFGSTLSVWDRLFGTLAFSGEARPFRFGLPRRLLNHHPQRLGSAWLGPISAALKRLGLSARCAPRTSPCSPRAPSRFVTNPPQ
jgi:sterol desaturase/sphingolipid hydroxylase (fatty acid hydroxylase superfamily)